ncbi:MAG: hypothetical protein WBD20_12585 [Pirellulaceae bacterium]
MSADDVTSTTADLTINQWVQPIESGVLKGRIVTSAADGTSVAVAKASVAVVNKDGQVFKSAALTDDKGEFIIKDVAPGVYALSARSGDFLAACAMHVLESTNDIESHFASEIEVSAASLEYATLREAIVRYLPSSTKPNDSAVTPVIKNELLGDLAAQVATPESFRVAQVSGGMTGQIFSAGVQGAQLPAAEVTNVFVLKNGKEVARTVTNEHGEFQIERLEIGNYSLMAIGPQGLGVVGFELVDENNMKTTDSVSTDGKRYVGLLSRLRARRCARQFAMQVAPVCNACDVCTTCDMQPVVQTTYVEAHPVVFQPQPTVIQSSCGCGQPASSCGCGIPVDPCGCGGTVIADAGYVEGQVVESIPMEGQIVDGGIIEGGIIDGGIVDGGFVDGVPVDGFGSSLAGGGGYTPGYGGGGGFSGGGGGGGGLLGGGGLGAIAALAGIGGIIAATTSDDDAVIVPAPIASPVFPN